MRTIRDQLIEKGIVVSLGAKEEVADTKISKKPKEQPIRREWAEIMGNNRETFNEQKAERFAAIDRRGGDENMG